MAGINVWFSPVDREIADDGLDGEHFRLVVEKRLACAGLRVIQQSDRKQVPEFPCLGVVLHVVRNQGDTPDYIYSIEMFFLQRLTLAGPPATNAIHLAWCREAVGDISRTVQGLNWSTLYKTSESLVDSFIVECFPSKAFVWQSSPKLESPLY
jgi:hypothetical protein